MIRLKEIQDKLIHLVGWQQAFDPDKYIKEELTISESGYNYQGQHPLVTLDNIAAIIPDDFSKTVKAWRDDVNYVVGEKVRLGNDVFIALKANINVSPIKSTDPDREWDVYNLLSDFIERETRDGISAMVTNFITKKVLTEETRNIIENSTLFDGVGRLAAVIDNRGKLCGYELTPARSMGVTIRINRIGLQMTGGVGSVRIYIFHSSQSKPMKTLDLNVTTLNGYQWFETPDLYLPYISDDHNSGGSWFLVYNQNNLPPNMEAVDVGKDFSAEPCGSCGRKKDAAEWRALMDNMGVHPFKVTAPDDFEDYPELWDIDDNVYTRTVNYGINLDLTVGCDLTDFIIRQKSIFANVLAKQVAANVLRKIAMNPDVKVNRNQLNVAVHEVLYEIDGNPTGRASGLGYQLDQAYKALSLDTKGLDRMCLGCKNRGVKYGSV